MSHRKFHGRVCLFLAACAVLLFVPVLHSAPAPDTSFLDALWVGESGSVVKTDGANGNLLLRLDVLKDARAVAVDDRAGTVWVFSEGNLHLYDFQGRLKNAFTVPMPPQGVPDQPVAHNLSGTLKSKYSYCTVNLLVPDELPPDVIWSTAVIGTSPEDGSAWLSLGSHLYQFSPEGNLLSDIDAGGLIIALTMDKPRSRVWISTCKELKAYEPDGSMVVSKRISSSLNYVRYIDYDASRDELWLVEGGQLQRLSPDGAQVFYKDLKDDMQGIVADGVGNAWLATDNGIDAKVQMINAAGTVLKEVKPFAGTLDDNAINAMAADYGGQSVWVASTTRLARANSAGQVTHTVTLQNLGGDALARILSLALYSDLIAPELSITSPANNAWLNDSTPAI